MLQPQRVFVNTNLPYINPDPFVFHFQLHFLDRHNHPTLKLFLILHSCLPSHTLLPLPPYQSSRHHHNHNQNKKKTNLRARKRQRRKPLSKRSYGTAKKSEATKQEKLRHCQEVGLAFATQSLSMDEDDPLFANYGDVSLSEL